MLGMPLRVVEVRGDMAFGCVQVHLGQWVEGPKWRVYHWKVKGTAEWY